MHVACAKICRLGFIYIKVRLCGTTMRCHWTSKEEKTKTVVVTKASCHKCFLLHPENSLLCFSVNNIMNFMNLLGWIAKGRVWHELVWRVVWTSLFPIGVNTTAWSWAGPLTKTLHNLLIFILLKEPPFLPFSGKVLQFKPTRLDTFLLLRRLNSPSILHDCDVLQQRCRGANVTVNPPSHNPQF